MAIIDQLVILLDLDPSKFNEGQKKALDQLKRTRDSAAGTAKELEARGAQAAAFFDHIASSALKLASILTAGVGIKDFIQGTTTAGAAAGRLAYNIGIGTGELGIWQSAVKLIGGDAGAAGASMMGLSQQMQSFALTGQSSIIPFFRAMHISLVDAQGNLKSVTDLYLEMADYAKTVSPQQFNFLARSIGLDQGTINLIERGRGAVEAYLRTAKQAGAVNGEQSVKLQNLESAWNNLGAAATTAGRSILTDAAPAMTAFLQGVTTFIEKNPEFSRAIGETAVAFTALATAITAVKFGAIIAGFSGVTGAIRGMAAAAAGIPAWLSGPLAGLYTFFRSSPLNEGEDAYIKAHPEIFGPPGTPPAPGAPGGPLSLFDLIQNLEGTPDGRRSPAGAVGRNQILPSTAAQYGFDPTKLEDPAYNDMVARAIEADLNKQFGGDLDAITIAYHNGPGAARDWIRSGRNDATLGPQTQRYLAAERSAVGGAGATTTVSIGQIIVNTPDGNPRTIAGGIRREMNSALTTQGNVGPQ